MEDRLGGEDRRPETPLRLGTFPDGRHPRCCNLVRLGSVRAQLRQARPPCRRRSGYAKRNAKGFPCARCRATWQRTTDRPAARLTRPRPPRRAPEATKWPRESDKGEQGRAWGRPGTSRRGQLGALELQTWLFRDEVAKELKEAVAARTWHLARLKGKEPPRPRTLVGEPQPFGPGTSIKAAFSAEPAVLAGRALRRVSRRRSGTVLNRVLGQRSLWRTRTRAPPQAGPSHHGASRLVAGPPAGHLE